MSAPKDPALSIGRRACEACDGASDCGGWTACERCIDREIAKSGVVVERELANALLAHLHKSRLCGNDFATKDCIDERCRLAVALRAAVGER